VVVKTEVRPAEATLHDAGLNPEKILGLEPVKKMLQLARGRARRRSSRSGVYMQLAARALAGGSIVSAAQLAARFGYHGKVTIARMGHALNALADVGFAIRFQDYYRLNEPGLRRFLVGG
jgi:hypothetical protein